MKEATEIHFHTHTALFCYHASSDTRSLPFKSSRSRYSQQQSSSAPLLAIIVLTRPQPMLPRPDRCCAVSCRGR